MSPKIKLTATSVGRSGKTRRRVEKGKKEKEKKGGREGNHPRRLPSLFYLAGLEHALLWRPSMCMAKTQKRKRKGGRGGGKREKKGAFFF